MARAASRDVVILGARRKAKLEAIARAVLAAGSGPPGADRAAGRCGLAERAHRRRAGLHADYGADLAAPVRPPWHARPGGRPRSGRPQVHGPDVRLAVVAAATSVPPEGTSVWTHALIAGQLAGSGISASQTARILAGLDLAPHKVRGWLNRRDDDQFWAQAAAVCDIYLRPPPATVVICIDEKTGIQAKYRKYPGQPARRGRPARRELEYVRNGTVSIIAALHVATGQVVTEPIAAAACGMAGAGYYLTVTGKMTLDTGWGRRIRPLGPFAIKIAALPTVVFDVIAAPYLGKTLQTMAGRLRVLERGAPADTAAARGRKRHAKTDKTDSRHLPQLLAEGRLPKCWIPPAQVLECRALLETYHDLRREHTAWVQRIHAVFFHQSAPQLGEGALRTDQGIAALRAADLSPAGQLQVATALDMLTALEARLEILRHELLDAARHLRGAKVPTARLYGVGPVTALAMTCWLGGAVLLLPQGGPVRRTGYHRLVFGPQRPARAPVPAGTAGAALGGA